jgi:putative oxidoreductase
MLNVAVEVGGAISLIIGLWPLFTALTLIALVPLTTWTTYRMSMFGAVFKQPQPVHLMKDLALVAGLLFYAVGGPGAWSLTGLRRA